MNYLMLKMQWSCYIEPQNPYFLDIFFVRADGGYTVRLKPDVNSARPQMWIKQSVPFIKANLFEDEPVDVVHAFAHAMITKPNEANP
jgi:hypothetical protein